jgi:MFS family permease
MVVMNSQIIGFADKKEQGEMMGILTSIMSLSTVIGPILGGIVYIIKPGLPFILAGIILFIVFFFISRNYKKIKNQEHIDVQPVEVL